MECDHDFEFVEVAKKWVGSRNQGGVEWGEYEDVNVYRCRKCGVTEAGSTGKTYRQQDGEV